MGVRLEHQHGDVKTEPPRHPSGPLQPRQRQQQSLVVVPAQRYQFDQQQQHPQDRSASPFPELSESAAKNRGTPCDTVAAVANPSGATVATERPVDADLAETHHSVLLRGLRKLFVHMNESSCNEFVLCLKINLREHVCVWEREIELQLRVEVCWWLVAASCRLCWAVFEVLVEEWRESRHLTRFFPGNDLVFFEN